MQTFLPVADFYESVKILDKKRAWKQVVEAKQILDILAGKTIGWKTHPAVLMWKSYETALTQYYNIFWSYCVKIHKIKTKKTTLLPESKNIIMPFWFGEEQFHSSHRSNLLRKNFEFYSQYGWQEPSDKLYVWPKTV